MDFLKNIAAKLEEFEEQARQAQEEALAKQRAQEKAARRAKSQEEEFQRAKRRSRQPVGSDTCPVGEVSSMETGSERTGSGLFDNLADHLDDAYILQEILGQPRCLREWDDDWG